MAPGVVSDARRPAPQFRSTKIRSATIGASSISTRPSRASRYRVNGVRYTREVFASHPDQVIVVRVTADRPASVSFGAWMDRPQDAPTRIVGNDRTGARWRARRRARAWPSRPRRRSSPKAARRRRFPSASGSTSADAVTIVRGRGHQFPRRRSGRARRDRRCRGGRRRNPTRACSPTIVADHQRLFRRVELRLGAPVAPRSLRCRPTNASIG